MDTCRMGGNQSDEQWENTCHNTSITDAEPGRLHQPELMDGLERPAIPAATTQLHTATRNVSFKETLLDVDGC